MTLNNYKTERYTNLDDEIETFPPRTTWKDVVALIIACAIASALVVAVIIIGH